MPRTMILVLSVGAFNCISSCRCDNAFNNQQDNVDNHYHVTTCHILILYNCLSYYILFTSGIGLLKNFISPGEW